MRGLARLGDKTRGICTAHDSPIEVDGVIVSGSQDSQTDGRPIARLGDTVKSNCGHSGTIISGAPTTFINGRPVARLGDSFAGTYSGTIISASSSTY